MKIVIGKAGGHNVAFDLDVLLPTRLLVQANSGGGKSYLLRVLCEQLFGKVQVIVIDPEGEFSTLREKFGYVLVGKGGETPADPRSAAIVAEKLLELNASAICDIYELRAQDRHRWVKVFVDALVNARKELWHPCVVIVDEAHVFCPEKGQGESEAYGAVSDLATRGRKRGFCPIFATQRIGKFSKNVAAECQNVLIGSTFLDVDRKRAAESLGVPRSEERAFFDELKMLEPGKFYALGRAVSRDRIMVTVAAAETSHPTAGSAKHGAAPPPLPDKVKHLLPKLADLPKAAEEKARTEQELRGEIRSLKAQLSHKPAAEIDEQAVQKAVEGAVRQRDRENQQQLSGYQAIIEKMQSAFAVIGKQSSQFVSLELPKERHAPTTIELPARRQIQKAVAAPRRFVATAEPTEGALGKGERIVLIAIASYPDGVGRDQLSVLTGYKRSSRDTYIQRLEARGFVAVQGDRIGATDVGIDALGSDYEPLPTGDALRDHWLQKLPEGERKVLEILIENYPQAVARETIDEVTGYARSSRDTYLQRLGSRRLVEQCGRGEVKAVGDLFD